MNLTNSKGREAAASITHANLGLRGKGTRVLAFLKESTEAEVSLGSCEHLEIAATLQTSNGKKTWVVIGQSSDLQRKTTTPVSAVMDSIRSLKSSKVKVVLDYEAGGRAWKGLSLPKEKWEKAQTAQFSKEWKAQDPRAWAMSWGAWENNRKEKFKKWGFSGKPKQARRSARQQPTRSDRANRNSLNASFSIFSTMMDRLSLRTPDRRTQRLFAHIVPD